MVMMSANWVHLTGDRPGSDCVFYQEGNGKFDFNPIRREEKPYEESQHHRRRRHTAPSC
jgi:hypothetical protein